MTSTGEERPASAIDVLRGLVGSVPGTARARRTAGVVLALLGVLGLVAWIVYAVGAGAVEDRWRAEQEFELARQTQVAEARLVDAVGDLELLASQDAMLNLLTGDGDGELAYSLRSAAADSYVLEHVVALDLRGEVVPSSDAAATTPVPEIRAKAAEHLDRRGRSCVLDVDDSAFVLVPVLFPYDETEVLGHLAARLRRDALVDGGLLDRATLLGRDGAVLAGHVPESDDGAGLALSRSVAVPAGMHDPGWRLTLRADDVRLGRERLLLARTVALLAGTCALLLVVVVVAHVHLERIHHARLDERVEALATLSSELERARAELVRVTRIAGTCEIATGVLHNASTVLEGLAPAARGLGVRLERTRTAALAEPAADPDALRTAAPPDEEREAAHAELLLVLRGLERLNELVESQRRLTSRSSVRESVDLAILVEDALTLARDVHAADVELVVEQELEPMPAVTLHRQRVVEILVQLVNNARQVADANGAARLNLLVRATRWGGGVRLEVRDDGKGVPDELATRIFQHGFTTREGATGYGLHAASNAAKELGGALHLAKARLGEGAAFVLDLPCEFVTKAA